MNLIPIANKLEFEGLGVPGKSLFVNSMPIECNNGILLRSPIYGTNIDYELPGYYKSQFMAVVRATEYTKGLELANEIMKALKLCEGVVLDDTMHVKYIRPAKLPITYPLSKGNLFEIQIPFDAVYVIEE